MSKQMSLFGSRATPPKWQVDNYAPQPGGLTRSKHADSAVQIDEHLEKLSWLMDSQFRVPLLNWRFGLNTFIDLIPGIGDAATTLVALYLMAAAVRYRVPKLTLVRMSFNIAVYFI